MSKSKLKQRLSHGTGPSASAVPCWGNAFALRCLVGWTSLEILGILRSEKNDRNCHVFPTVEALGYLGLKPRKKKTGFIRFNQVSWGLWGLESSHGYENHIETDWNPFFWCWGNHPTGLHLAAIHGHKAYRAIHGAGRWIPTCAQHRSPSYVGNIR